MWSPTRTDFHIRWTGIQEHSPTPKRSLSMSSPAIKGFDKKWTSIWEHSSMPKHIDAEARCWGQTGLFRLSLPILMWGKTSLEVEDSDGLTNARPNTGLQRAMARLDDSAVTDWPERLMGGLESVQENTAYCAFRRQYAGAHRRFSLSLRHASLFLSSHARPNIGLHRATAGLDDSAVTDWPERLLGGLRVYAGGLCILCLSEAKRWRPSTIQSLIETCLSFSLLCSSETETPTQNYKCPPSCRATMGHGQTGRKCSH